MVELNDWRLEFAVNGPGPGKPGQGVWGGRRLVGTHDLKRVSTEHFPCLMQGGFGPDLWQECFGSTSYGGGSGSSYEPTMVGQINVDRLFKEFTDAEDPFVQAGVQNQEGLPGQLKELVLAVKKVAKDWDRDHTGNKHEPWTTEDVQKVMQTIGPLTVAMMEWSGAR